MKEIQEHKIKIYEFPETDDEEENKLVKKIKVPKYIEINFYSFMSQNSVQMGFILMDRVLPQKMCIRYLSIYRKLWYI